MSNATMMTNPRSVAVQQPTIPPLPPINVPLPEKMEIRVVEYTKGLRLVKTELQYRMWHYDEYGMVVSNPTEWEQVERVRIDLDKNIA